MNVWVVQTIAYGSLLLVVSLLRLANMINLCQINGCAAILNAAMAGAALLNGHPAADGSAPAWVALAAVHGALWWKSRNDDDDDQRRRRRRLRSWARSHLPRPRIVAVRPVEHGSGA